VAPAFFACLQKCTSEVFRLRFFPQVRDSSHKFFARLTQMDDARDMECGAFGSDGELLGVVRLHADAERESGEYAILLRSDLKGQGLGWALMKLVITYGQAERFKRIEGQVLAENSNMLDLCKSLGFQLTRDRDDPDIVVAELDLASLDKALFLAAE